MSAIHCVASCILPPNLYNVQLQIGDKNQDMGWNLGLEYEIIAMQMNAVMV